MKSFRLGKKNRQRGFSLVVAIFVLVIMALIGSSMVTILTLQNSTVSYGVQGTRAYLAALSGVDWAIEQAITNHACPAAASFGVGTGGPGNFTVSVTCT